MIKDCLYNLETMPRLLSITVVTQWTNKAYSTVMLMDCLNSSLAGLKPAFVEVSGAKGQDSNDAGGTKTTSSYYEWFPQRKGISSTLPRLRNSWWQKGSSSISQNSCINNTNHPGTLFTSALHIIQYKCGSRIKILTQTFWSADKWQGIHFWMIQKSQN